MGWKCRSDAVILFAIFHFTLLTYAQNLGTEKKARNIFVFICEHL